MYQRDARLLKTLEAKLTQEANFVWTFSDDDVSGHHLTPETGCLLPLYVANVAGHRNKVKKTYDVGLIGTWSWQPNFVGLQWFVEEVGPLLPQTMTIAIAGSVPDKPLSAGANVHFLGRVDSATEFLDSVHVIPLVSRGGTGVQLKTIEAFQAGYACVATQSSLRGIDQIPANCIAADAPQLFADALVDQVSRSKSNKLLQVSGQTFLDRQKSAMTKGLERGIGTLA